MKLTNGKQTVKFLNKVAAPFDHYNVGEVAGFDPEDAAKLLAAKTQAGTPAVIDFVPTTAAEIADLSVQVQSGLIADADAVAVADGLVKAKVLDADGGKELKAQLAKATKARDTAASAPPSNGQMAELLAQIQKLLTGQTAPAK